VSKTRKNVFTGMVIVMANLFSLV